MALVNRTFMLDITPGAIPQVVKVSEYDVNRAYTVTLVDEGGVFEIPSGTTAKVEGTLGGNAFSEAATVSGNTIVFELSESMTAYAGDAWVKIKLTKDSKPIQTAAFILRCDRAGVEADAVIGAPGFEEQIKDAMEDYLEDNPIPVDQEQIRDAVDYWFDNHGGVAPTVNVKAYGAKGDGTTDDTTAIQSAINHAQTNNIRDVYFPSGTYLITAPIVLTTGAIVDEAGSRYWDGNGTVLTGENVGTTRIIKRGTATYQSASAYSDTKKQTFAQTAYDAVVVGDGQATGHVIRNLTLVNESSATDAYTIVAWVSRMTIENVNSVTTSHGVNLYSYFNRIENVRFNGASDVLHIDDGTSAFVSRTFISGAANPYYIKSAYSVLSNMAADGCTGSIYQVGGAGVVMNGCGAESPGATYHIYCPTNDTELTVVGGMWYGQTTADAALVSLSKNRCKVSLLHPCISIHANTSADRYLVHVTTSVSGIEFNCHDLSYQNASGYTYTEYGMADHNPASGTFTVDGRPVDHLGNPRDWKMGESGAVFWNGSEFVPAVYRQITPTNYNVTPTLGKRLTADGEADYASMWITDYIPCASGDVIYGKLYLNDRSAQALAMYDSSKNLLKYVAFNNLSNAAYGVTYNGGTTAASGANSLVIPIGEGSGWNASTAFIRLTGHNNLAPASCPFTVNETTEGITADFALRGEVPTKVSELANDSSYLTLQTLPIYSGGVS